MYRPNETDKDNELAEFTDRVLAGKADANASDRDADLVSLEKTILRLSHARPSDSLEDARAKHMLVRLKARIRREEEERPVKTSIWKRFFDFQSNPQVGLLIAVAVMLVLAIVSLPGIQLEGGSITGTAISGANFFVGIGLIGILLVIYWISRRK